MVGVALLVAVALFAGEGSRRSAISDGQKQVRSSRDAAVRALTQQADDFTRTVAA